MSVITMVEEDLDGFRGEACLVRDNEGRYFVISTITRDDYRHAYGDVETMAFLADEDGNILDWSEVCGGGDMSRDEVIQTLAQRDYDDWAAESGYCFDAEMHAEDEWNDWFRDDPSLGEYDSSIW